MEESWDTDRRMAQENIPPPFPGTGHSSGGRFRKQQWEEFVKQLHVFRKKSWKEKGAGESLGPAHAEPKEVLTVESKYTCWEGGESPEKAFTADGIREGRRCQPHLIPNTSTGCSKAASFLCARGEQQSWEALGLEGARQLQDMTSPHVCCATSPLCPVTKLVLKTTFNFTYSWLTQS